MKMLYQVWGYCGKDKKVVYEGMDSNEGISAELNFAKDNFKAFTKTSWYCKDTECDVRKDTWVALPYGLTRDELLADTSLMEWIFED